MGSVNSHLFASTRSTLMKIWDSETVWIGSLVQAPKYYLTRWYLRNLIKIRQDNLLEGLLATLCPFLGYLQVFVPCIKAQRWRCGPALITRDQFFKGWTILTNRCWQDKLSYPMDGDIYQMNGLLHTSNNLCQGNSHRSSCVFFSAISALSCCCCASLCFAIDFKRFLEPMA